MSSGLLRRAKGTKAQRWQLHGSRPEREACPLSHLADRGAGLLTVKEVFSSGLGVVLPALQQSAVVQRRCAPSHTLLLQHAEVRSRHRKLIPCVAMLSGCEAAMFPNYDHALL